MKARHEFTSDRKYYNYLKTYMSVEFIKSAIIADDYDEDTIVDNVFNLCNQVIEKIISENKISENKNINNDIKS
jgi:hypothetical protein